MRNGINITNSRLLLLIFAFYSNAAFSTGLTSGIDDSGRVILIFLIFFVFPAIGLLVVFVIARIYFNRRKKRKLSETDRDLSNLNGKNLCANCGKKSTLNWGSSEVILCEPCSRKSQ